jgi:hypothetical protein
MSAPRFASITSGLLARKGEAQPWHDAKRPLAWDGPEPVRLFDAPRALMSDHHAMPDHEHIHATAADCKKCTVRMSHHDYERLGIVAVKEGKTRQRLLQEAVDQMIAGISRNYGSSCPCLGAEQRPPAL